MITLHEKSQRESKEEAVAECVEVGGVCIKENTKDAACVGDGCSKEENDEKNEKGKKE